MFSLSSLLSLLLSAMAVAATPGLLVQLSAPSTIHGVHNFKVVTTIINSGDETLRLLNHPDSLLSDLPTDHFTLTNDRGASPAFSGIRVSYAVDSAIASGNASGFTTLAPGRSVDIEHDLSEAYDFAATGAGKYTVKLKDFNTFYYTAGKEVKTLLSGAGQAIHTVSLSGSMRSPRRSTSADDCGSDDMKVVNDTLPDVKRFLSSSIAELNREGYNGQNYQTWFGAPDDSRLNTVSSHYQRISQNRFDQFSYQCRTQYCSNYPLVIAYVYPDDFGVVHLCPIFFSDLPPAGTGDSRASTLIHEASHFTANGGTKDHDYGQERCQKMAREHPEDAVTNASNHEYFSANARGSNFKDASADRVLVAQAGFSEEYFGF